MNEGLSKAPEAPIGKAKELEAVKETLPTLEVENTVLWVNPELQLPFKLEVGQPTELGIFLTPQSEMSKDRSRRVEVSLHHKRSGFLGRVIFSEKKKDGVRPELYRDIDVKGLGYLNKRKILPKSRVGVVPVKQLKHYGKVVTLGIMNLEDAQKDAFMAELLHKQGVRTHRAIAIISLDEIIDAEGKKIKIEEAKKLGILLKSDKPVLEIRAFGTKTRLEDVFSDHTTPEMRELFLEDARVLVAQELGKNPEEFSRLEYFKWLAGEVGRNIGLLRKNRWKHSYLIEGHNITLDGRLVDFDSVTEIKPWGISYILNTDSSSSKVALGKLFRSVGLDKTQQKIILKEYTDAYNDSIESGVVENKKEE